MQIDVTYLLETVPADNFAAASAQLILAEMASSIAARGQCRLALAGGETPRAIYAEMAKLGAGLAWERVIITFGDERCVPPDDAQSNYLMAKSSLLDHVPIPAENVLRIKGEAPQAEAAEAYETDLALLASQREEPRFVHDLILLGMGEDGHTASLFPGGEAVDETVRNVVPTHGPKPPPLRVTMTLPLLNAARKVWFLAKDAGKAPMLSRVLAGDPELPAARVRPADGVVTWVVSDQLDAALRNG